MRPCTKGDETNVFGSSGFQAEKHEKVLGRPCGVRWRMKHPVVIIGGGIVGLATALSLVRQRITNVCVLEAESRLAAHQTGHNSGVIHSGLYYRPGSMKARYCVEGREALYRFCAEQGVAHERCGKIVVAVSKDQLPALEMLEERSVANGLDGVRRLSLEEMREREPHVAGVAGLLVPQTGIVDFVGVAEAYARLIREAGGVIRTAAPVRAIRADRNGFVLQAGDEEQQASHIINCAGLDSDRIAQMAGLNPDVRIIPFRGQYVKLKPAAESLVRHLIYPVPDPQFPFLGVHFTRMVHGGVEAGPNAVLTFRRHWYQSGDKSRRDFRILGYPGFWRMAGRYARMGCAEMWRARSLSAFVHALQALVPDVRVSDVEPHGSGVRAQAVGRDGRLVDDFRILEGSRQIHVLNAPSPAATASLSIGNHVAQVAMARLGLRAS